MKLFYLLQNWWYARQRDTDLLILWPRLKRQAQQFHRVGIGLDALSMARRGFLLHMKSDSAWKHTLSWNGGQVAEFVEKNLT